MSCKTVMVGDKRYHLPFVDLVPFDAEQDQELGKSIYEAGRAYVPAIGWKEKSSTNDVWIIDGAHRLQWCAQHGIDAPKVLLESFDSEDEAKERCEELNLERRHLTEAARAKHRRERVERIAQRRRQGESFRAIADAENVSESLVRKDLENAQLRTRCAVEPLDGVTHSRDGKLRPSEPIRCKRCQRLGAAVKNCKQCEAAKKEQAKRKAAAKRRKEAEREEELKVDCFATPVPKHLHDVLFDPWIQEDIDFLGVTAEAFRRQRLSDRMQKKAKRYPFFQPGDYTDACGFISNYFDQLIEHLKDNRPAAVCPHCNGEKCPQCRMSGLLPRSIHPRGRDDS